MDFKPTADISTIPCSRCRMRARYDSDPKSFLGRLWHWHTGFCPGWKVYMSSVSTEERKELVKKYDIPTKEIYLAGGCFWGVEKYFKLVRGVVGTETGYANGSKDNPSYEEVYTDSTGHAETVRVKYVPVVVSLNTLLELYFKAIDPFSLNKQGEDEGTRYRTGIYFTDEKDKAVVNRFIEAKTAELKARPVVEVRPLKCFFSAEEYHQDYLDKNPGGYCHLHPELFEYVKNL